MSSHIQEHLDFIESASDQVCERHHCKMIRNLPWYVVSAWYENYSLAIQAIVYAPAHDCLQGVESEQLLG